jgi:tetratricopeptide (TPR) repeat protein
MGDETEALAARESFARGRLAFERGDHRGALALFERAYTLAPRPELLFNIARCREEMHDLRGAIDAYRLYLPLAPESDRVELAHMIKRLELRLAEAPVLSTAAPAVAIRGPRRAWIAAAVLVPIAVAGLALGLGLGLGLGGPSARALPPPTWSPSP